METSPPWPELLVRFLAYEAAVAGLAPATLRNRRIYLEGFARWWHRSRPDRPVTMADNADLSEFLVGEAERGLAPRSRKAVLGALRRLYDWLVLTGACAVNPARQLTTPRVPPTDIVVYRPVEVAGMRSGELRGLCIRELDLAAGQARVVGKGSRPRIVLLPDPLVAIVRRFLDEDRPRLPVSPLLLANAHPFVTTPAHGFGQEALAREVELAGLGAGVAGRHFPHRWRHTFATELVRDGVDVHVVQRLLGHTSIASTVCYTHLALDDLRHAIDRRW